MRRQRKAKIVATLGPASSSQAEIEALFLAGVDVFRLNFSHGSHADHKKRYDIIRHIEQVTKRPIGVLVDLQGPKLRVGQFENGSITLEPGQKFRFDLDAAPGDQRRAPLPHPEILSALKPGVTLLLDDGKLRMRVLKAAKDAAECEVEIGGKLSDRKGVNVPDVVLPLSPLTKKDRTDLTFALDLGADWIALSFVQRPEDVAEARKLIAGRARIIAKLEKPAAIEKLEEIVDLSDAIMVARGDLGVEMPAEDVPGLQKRIIAACRLAGKPVVVATQMLDSMVNAPTPTRAEASDVATAVYDGADAVMLSAETASGQYPLESVAMMNRIAERVERDPFYRRILEAQRLDHSATESDAISQAAAQVAQTLSVAAIVSYTTSGSTGLRMARERPAVPIMCLTSKLETARNMALVWGTHCVVTADLKRFSEMAEKATRIALREDFAKAGDRIVVTAGVPLGTPGSTNILRVAWVEE
ncbi:pyruvate kinase [Dongia sp.]|uniref:pyruvate kinase n=1 Tax=Dongia sp. TaxID=1977262 RepID=UPI0035B394A7